MSEKKSETITMADLMAEVDEQLKGYRGGFDPGEQIRGQVVSVTKEHLVIDLHSKIEGIVNIEDLPPDEPTPTEGDFLDLFFVQMQGGAARLSPRIAGSMAAVEQSLRNSFESGLPLEGLVEKEINGGYEINIAGQRAFCPYSQIGLFRSRDDDSAEIIGQRMTFLVSEFDPEQKTLVVSHREVLERERLMQREALQAELREGDIREGSVTKIMPFGVFVDLGGVEGLIPLKELSWDRSLAPEDLVSPGQNVTVSVVALDWENDRFTLSLRGTQRDPWLDFAEDFVPGQYLTVTVTKLMPFGAFAQIEPGVEGLIPISRLGGGRRISHPREAVSEGDRMDVQIDSIDSVRKRVSLKPVDERIQSLKPGVIAVGATLRGIVEGIRDFGVFVRIAEDKTGLLHIGECKVERGGNPLTKLEQKFKPGDEIEVIVKSMDESRIGLALPGEKTERTEEELAHMLETQNKTAAKDLGSLGDLFSGLNL